MELYEMEREGATPPGNPLVLTFSKSMTIEDKDMGYTSYALAANLRDFIDYMDNDPEGRLFARNVRLDLRSEINRNIKNTYLTAPKEFWYSHNGITVICSNATIKGESIRLVNPSVINESQTLNTLRGISKRFPETKVLTRVLVIQGEEEKEGGQRKKFINDVIFRTNQQNKMYAYDLRANDIRQVELARDSMNNSVFYERRRGEWYERRRAFQNQGIERLNCVELAQILAAFNPNIGAAVAKKGKEELFRKDETYDGIFYKSFPEIYLAFRVFRFVSDAVKEIPSRKIKPRMRRHALFTVAAILHDTVVSGRHYDKIKSAIGTVNHIWGTRYQSQHSYKL